MDVAAEVQQATFALGLVCEATETQELFLDYQNGAQPDKLVKELGDVLWHMAGLCTLFGIRLGDVCVSDPERAMFAPPHEVQNLSIEAGKVSDYMKKVVGHGHDLDKQHLCDGLALVYHSLLSLCSSFELDIGDVAEANIEKLRRRYPEGFSSERSIKRSQP